MAFGYYWNIGREDFQKIWSHILNQNENSSENSSHLIRTETLGDAHGRSCTLLITHRFWKVSVEEKDGMPHGFSFSSSFFDILFSQLISVLQSYGKCAYFAPLKYNLHIRDICSHLYH